MFAYLSLTNCESNVENDKDKDREEGVFKDGKISFSTPDLSDEESHSPFMPDTLKCDACLAVAFQVSFHCFFVTISSDLSSYF